MSTQFVQPNVPNVYPTWAKVTVGVLVVAGALYVISKYMGTKKPSEAMQEEMRKIGESAREKMSQASQAMTGASKEDPLKSAVNADKRRSAHKNATQSYIRSVLKNR